jgi:hypothetical protein
MEFKEYYKILGVDKKASSEPFKFVIHLGFPLNKIFNLYTVPLEVQLLWIIKYQTSLVTF